MPKYKFLFSLVVFFILFFSFVTKVRANYTFIDDFWGTYRSEWSTIANHLTPQVFNNSLLFDVSTASTTFPYISHTSNDPIKSLSFDFQYVIDGSDYGSGVVVTESVSNLEGDPAVDSNDYIFAVYVMNDGKFYLFSPLCQFATDCGYISNAYIFYSLEPGKIYNLRLEFSNNSLDVYVDSFLIKSFQMSGYRANGIYFGNTKVTDTPKYWQNFLIDNVNILYSDYSISESSFPYFSQKDPLWGEHEYDSASEWAGVDKSGINRWGCALTSAAMMLEKFEVKALDGNPINPDILNDWLKEQEDGYVGPGFVNWLAITRYAKGRLPDGKSLEFERSYDPALLTLPSILGIPGHFVVGYDDDATNWIINDPANETTTTLAKTSTIKSINRFVTSNTDLSYMMFVSSALITGTLINEAGDTIPLNWSDEYLDDDVDGGSNTHLKVAMLPKPPPGKYTLTVDKDEESTGEIKIYLYDNLASEIEPDTYPLTDPINYFEINYASASAGVRSVVPIDLTPPPVPTPLSPIDGAYLPTTGLVLDWSDVDDPSTPVIYNYKSESVEASVSASMASISDWSDGTYKWSVRACDSVDNCSAWSNERTLTIDTIVPTLSSAPDTSPNPTNLTAQEWSWEAGVDIGSQILDYGTRTQDVLTDSPLTDWLWIGKVLSTSTNWTEGKWRLELKTKDLAGNESEITSSDEIVVDTTAPTLLSQTSLNDDWYNTSQKIVFEYGDENLLSDYIDPYCEIDTESSASYCWVKPYICDAAGNCNNEQIFSKEIKLDLTKPTITLNAWGSTINGTAGDILSGVEKVELKLTKPGESENTITAVGTTSWTYTMDSAPLGTYKVIVVAYDKAGNKSDEITKEFTISPTPTPIPTPSPLGEVLGESDEELINTMPSLNPSPSTSTSPTGGEVRGESTEKTRSWNKWILVIIALGGIGLHLLSKRIV